ncbi:MAG: sodium/glutamate symporter [Pirellulaceae bacterium]
MLEAILAAAGLLGVGFLLRQNLSVLRWIFVPASIVGGLVGLGIVQCFDLQSSAVVSSLSSWPGLLIAVVFACMFLERGSSKSIRQSASLAAREGVMVWVLVLGQTAVGLLCTWLIIQPLFDVPNSFGMLIETGFAGGHGTAAAMGDVFASPEVNLTSGRDLGLFMATIGLMLSVVSGVFYVNLALRLGWTKQDEPTTGAAKAERSAKTERVATPSLNSESNTAQAEPMAFATVKPEVVDPLVFQLLIVAMAFGIGWLLKLGVSEAIGLFAGMSSESATDLSIGAGDVLSSAAEDVLDSRVSLSGTLGDFPLFIYTLFGGMMTRRVFSAFGASHLIDTASIQRISGVAMEFLIVAAIASLRIEVLNEFAWPLLVLITAAFLWTGFCLTVLARWLLPKDYWFELGILNYGMSTGTTATGFSLLKIVDPDLKSGAAEDYALAAPLSAPFVGGGMLTVGLPLLVLEQTPIAITAMGSVGIVIALIFLARHLSSMSRGSEADRAPDGKP